jgi:hypothetical protein
MHHGGAAFLLMLGAIGCGAAPGPEAAKPEPAPSAPGPEPGAGAASEPAEPVTEGPLPPGTHRILLTRPDRVGARARVRRVTSDVRTTRTSKNGGPPKTETVRRRVELDAVTEIRAVDDNRRATEIRYVIDRLEAAGPKGLRPILPPKSELVVLRKAGTPGELRIESQPLDEASLQALKSVIPTTLGVNTEQHVFGTTEPRKIGDSWPVDADRARDGIAEVGIRSPGKARGTTRVVEQRQEGGEDCLFVLGQLELDRFELPDMPQGARTERSRLAMRFSGAYPLDLARPVRRQNISISMQLRVVVRESGQQLNLSIDSVRETDSRIDPL